MKIVTTCALVALFFIPGFLSPSDAVAGPGDTLVVQTFDWSWPVNPGWNSPKEGWFEFPSPDLEVEKVLMYYTLKCDPSQNPACGEWDYLTYTRLYEHTGRLDSNQLAHPNFTVLGATPDELPYMSTTSWRYLPRTRHVAIYDDTTSFASGSIGSGADAGSSPAGMADPDARSLYLWRAGELSAAGLSAGRIATVRLNFTDVATLKHLRIMAKFVNTDELTVTDARLDGFTTVYDADLQLAHDGWNTLDFLADLDWDGQQNLLLDFRVTRIDAASDVLATDAGWNATLSAAGRDRGLQFEPGNTVQVPHMDALDNTSAFTVEFWARMGLMDTWASIFQQKKNNEHRVGMQFGNETTPERNLYCLIGNGSNTHGHTTNAPFKAGAWQHVAMVYDGTKNTNAERLVLYLDGVQQALEFTGDIPAVTTTITEDMFISTKLNGMLDELRIWGTALDLADIRARMFDDIDAADPLRPQLLAYWPMNEGQGRVLPDHASANHGTLNFPQWMDFGGDRFRNFTASSLRPDVLFQVGTTPRTVVSNVVIDTVEQAPMLVVLYGDTTRANMPTDSMVVWPEYYTYTFDSDGMAVDSQLVPFDGRLVREDHFYYDTPYEVINRYELGRYITPYGIGLDLGEGWTWVFDVSDFRQLLADSVHLTAGNFQELLDMKFVFIEGTPPRDVKSIENVWNGNFALNNFEALVPPKSVTLHPEASMFKLRTSATGHQFSNATNCAEFCPKMHSILVDGITRASWQIVQECAENPLYPQGGTWIYDRAGWCPGMEASIRELELTPFITSSTVEIDYNSQWDEYGNYVFESQLVSYGPANHALDAAIERVLAPSDYELHSRWNPVCGQPRIIIKNAGSTPLTTLTITYGPRGGNSTTYQWSGSLDFLETAEVTLPAFDWGNYTSNIFDVELSAPNGGSDEYVYNDRQHATFESVPVHDQPLVLILKTNNYPYQNRYEVRDQDGNIVYGQSGFLANTQHRDTLRLPPGCYELLLLDSGNDGLEFWANPNQGAGYLRLREVNGSLWHTLDPDFGKYTRYAWRYSSLVGVDDIVTPVESFDLYPNPAGDFATVRFVLDRASHVQFDVYNLLGQKVLSVPAGEKQAGEHMQMIPAASLQPGTYFVNLLTGNEVRRRVKLHIQR